MRTLTKDENVLDIIKTTNLENVTEFSNVKKLIKERKCPKGVLGQYF